MNEFESMLRIISTTILASIKSELEAHKYHCQDHVDYDETCQRCVSIKKQNAFVDELIYDFEKRVHHIDWGKLK